jgi:hypothetical protein
MPTKRLTDQFVERLQPPSRGRVEYFDAAFPALSLRVSEHGHKAWSIFYRVNGNPKLRRYKLGIFPHIKPAKARLLATEALDQVRSGVDPGSLRKHALVHLPISTPSTLWCATICASMSRSIAVPAPTALLSACSRSTY